MKIDHRLTPEECQGMEDIRAEIDALDRAVITLIGRRARYVHAAAKFKTSATSVRAPERLAALLKKRREWAEEEGLSPDVIEKLYADLVDHFISEEMKQWARGSDASADEERR